MAVLQYCNVFGASVMPRFGLHGKCQEGDREHEEGTSTMTTSSTLCTRALARSAAAATASSSSQSTNPVFFSFSHARNGTRPSACPRFSSYLPHYCTASCSTTNPSRLRHDEDDTPVPIMALPALTRPSNRLKPPLCGNHKLFLLVSLYVLSAYTLFIPHQRHP